MNASVIITTKNRKDFLIDAIYSVVNQTHKPKEIIIIDDNSDDSITLDDLSFQNENNIKIEIHYSTENKGSNYSRNLGAKLAESEVLMFLDDDDTWEPNKIKDQLEVFKSDEIGLVFTGKKFVKSINRSKVIRNSFPQKQGDLSKLIYTDNWIGSTSCIAVKKVIFDRSGGFDESLKSLQDYDLCIRICQIARIGHDNKCNLRYTIHQNPANQISGQLGRHIESAQVLYKKYSYSLINKEKRKFRSYLNFIVGKSLIDVSPFRSLNYLGLSFFSKPEFRKLYFMLKSLYSLLKK